MKKLFLIIAVVFASKVSYSQTPYNMDELASNGQRLVIWVDEFTCTILDADTKEYISRKDFKQKYGKDLTRDVINYQKNVDEGVANFTERLQKQETQNKALDELLAIKTYQNVSYAENTYSYLLDKLDGKDDNNVDYQNAALFIRDNVLGLDKDGNISMVSMLDVPNCSKERIYIQANSWFVNTFVSGEDVIQLNDKEAGVILAKGYMKNIAEHVGFGNSYEISAYVIFRIDIKDNKARLITTIQSYKSVNRGGVVGAIAAGLNGVGPNARYLTYQPNLEFPFAQENLKMSKKAGAKAYCACCLYMIALKNQLFSAITDGITGFDGDDW